MAATDQSATTHRAPSSVDAALFAVVALVLTGIALRCWILVSHLGVLDADSAVPGLMAMHFRHGGFRAFYWGQPYAGTLEQCVLTALLLVLPASATLVKVIPMLFAALAAIGTWFLGRHFLDERVARLAGATLWAFPPPLLWYSGKIGSYWPGLALAVVGAGFAVRAAGADMPRVKLLLAAGVALGLAWWTNPQMLYVAIPIGLITAVRFVREPTRLALLVVGFVAGAAPWLWHNALNGWESLHSPTQVPTGPNHYTDHVKVFGKVLLPMAVGLRHAYTLTWVLGVVGQAAYVAVFVAGLCFVAFGPRRYFWLRLMLLALPVIHGVWTYSWFAAFPRYATYFLPALSLAIAVAMARNARTVVVGTAMLIALSVAGMVDLDHVVTAGTAPDAPIAPTGPLVRALEKRGVRHGYANYWLAYRLTFETRERVILADPATDRYPPYLRAAREDPASVYVFPKGSKLFDTFRDIATRRDIRYTTIEVPGYVVARPVGAPPDAFESVWF